MASKVTSRDLLHGQIASALRELDFKRNAAGKSGEDLKLAVVTATSHVGVEVISVGLSLPETHAGSPYQARWRAGPGAKVETTYFDV